MSINDYATGNQSNNILGRLVQCEKNNVLSQTVLLFSRTNAWDLVLSTKTTKNNNPEPCSVSLSPVSTQRRERERESTGRKSFFVVAMT